MHTRLTYRPEAAPRKKIVETKLTINEMIYMAMVDDRWSKKIEEKFSDKKSNAQ